MQQQDYNILSCADAIPMLDVVGMPKLCLSIEMVAFIIIQFNMSFFMLWASTMNSVAVTVTITSALCGRTSLIVSLHTH